MIKKIVCVLLVTVLIASFSACGQGNNNTASGQQAQEQVSYSETEIGSGSGIVWPADSRVDSKGRLVVLDNGNGRNPSFAILDRDGKPAGNINPGITGMIAGFALDAQDNIYAMVAEMKDGNISPKLMVISPVGKILRELTVNAPQNSGEEGLQGYDYSDIAVDSAGNIYLASPSTGVQVLDKDGNQVKILGSDGCQSIDIDKDGNVIASYFSKGKNSIDKLDSSKGKSIWSTDLPVKNGTFSVGSEKVRYSKKDDCIYYMDSQGISKYDSSGKAAGTALDFRSYSILASGYDISDMCIDSSGNIFVMSSNRNGAMVQIGGGPGGKGGTVLKGGAVAAGDGKTSGSGASTGNAVSATGGGKTGNMVVSGGPDSEGGLAEGVKYEIYRYSPQSGNSVQKQTTITVSIPASDRTLDMAISKFSKDNPGFKVDVQTYPSQDATGSDYDTYVKNLNTQILSGKGPDIMSVAGLPFNNFIARNILANLSDVMAKDKSFDINNYYTNILDAFKYNGSLYVLPTNFAFDVLMANQGVLDKLGIKIDDSKWTWGDFKSIAEQINKNGGPDKLSAIPSLAPDQLLDMFTRGSYSNFIDTVNKKASFDSQGFIDLLNTARDLGSLADNSIGVDKIGILQAAMRGNLVFYPQVFMDYNMYGFMKSAFKDKLSIYSTPSASGNNDGLFASGSLYAISRSTKYADKCWDLLKTLISDEVQSSDMGGMSVKAAGKAGGAPPQMVGGFSINKTAQQKKAQQAIDMSQKGKGKMMMGGPNGNSISLDAAPMTQADIDYINKIISGLKTYANVDTNIYSIVQDETKAFFSGGKSAEETAKLIQDRANTYVGE